MNRKKLVFFTCFSLFLGYLLYFSYIHRSSNVDQKAEISTREEQKQIVKTYKRSSNFNPSYPAQEDESLTHQVEINEQLSNIKKFCEEEFPQYKESFPSVQTLRSALNDPALSKMWLNIHLKGANNEVWRLRRFIDDGQNGGREKVVLYKEDETGFPRIIESSEDYKDQSPSELFKKFRNKGLPIFTDEAYSVLKDGVDYFFELTNGQITRIDVTSTKHQINCQVPN
jgi:hypothetical protein